MNKLMGFYELKNMNLPSVPWREYTGGEKLSPDRLWTVRTAVFTGDDLNLPRAVGVKAEEAAVFADHLLEKLCGKGIVVYYPYFVAKKSGTLNVYKDRVVIEAVKEDLWNLVTYSKRDVTIRMKGAETMIDGDRDFLSGRELHTIQSCIPEIRRLFRDELTEGSSILLEWSFAVDCDREKKTVGEEYLVFYEARTV